MYLGTAKKRGSPRSEVDLKEGVSLGTEFEFRAIPPDGRPISKSRVENASEKFPGAARQAHLAIPTLGTPGSAPEIEQWASSASSQRHPPGPHQKRRGRQVDGRFGGAERLHVVLVNGGLRRIEHA